MVGYGIPTPEEQKEIFAEAKKQEKEYREHQDKMRQCEFEYYERLWEIDHPIQAGWRKFKEWLSGKRLFNIGLGSLSGG